MNPGTFYRRGVDPPMAFARSDRGFCVLELDALLASSLLDALAGRFGVQDALAWARRHPHGSVAQAEQVAQAFVGVPLETAQKASSDVPLHPAAAAVVTAARAAGLEVVLLARGFRPVAQQLGHRLGIDTLAGWEPEVSYGRFSGRIDLPWSAHGEAVCGERLVRDMRRRLGRPAVAVSSTPDPCLFGAADEGVAVGHRHGAARMASDLHEVATVLEGLHVLPGAGNRAAK